MVDFSKEATWWDRKSRASKLQNEQTQSLAGSLLINLVLYFDLAVRLAHIKRT